MQETDVNVKIYLITEVFVSIVDTRLRLPTATLLKRKECRQECNLNFIITNCWVRLATRCGWATPLLPGLPRRVAKNVIRGSNNNRVSTM